MPPRTYTPQTHVDGTRPTGFLINGVPATIASVGEIPGTPLDAAHQNYQETGISNAQITANEALAAASSPSAALPLVYPVGSIYMNTLATNPAALFGFGTWAALAPGRMLIGVGTSDVAYAAGATGGESNHTLTTPETPAHGHVQNAHTHVHDPHNHTQNSHNHTQNSHNHTQDPHHHGGGYATNGGTAGNITGGSPVNTDDTTATNQAATATNIAATATNIAATSTGQSTTATNQNTGGGGAHNNMPPYLVVYMWKRTA